MRWAPVVGWEQKYEVSDCGDIRSKPRTHIGLDGRERVFIGGPIRWRVSKGYCVVTLVLDGRRNVYMVHRLVAEAFLPNPRALPQVNHRDGIKTNNHWRNLEWVTARANRAHAARMGLTAKGARNGSAVLTERQAQEVRYLYENDLALVQDLSERYGISRQTVRLIGNRTTWGHLPDLPTSERLGLHG